jgi:hypothetical protein
MGIRGELFSTKVILQNRTYFFNVKENRLGDLYLNIVESKNREEGGFERQSVILFAEDLQEFLQGFDDALRVLEKSVREKRRGTPNREPRDNEQRGNEQSYREPRYKEQSGREQTYREPRYKEQRNEEPRTSERRFREPRGTGFRKSENDRRPMSRQSSGHRTRDDAFSGRPRRSEGPNRDQNREHPRKRVVVKHRKPRTD